MTSLPGLRWPGVVTSLRFQTMDQIELNCVKLETLVESEPKAPFSIATTPRCWVGRYSFPWIDPLYF